MALLKTAVDFRASLRFPRAWLEPPRLRLWGLQSPATPAGQGMLRSDTSHEENAYAFSRSLRLARKSTARKVSEINTYIFHRLIFQENTITCWSFVRLLFYLFTCCYFYHFMPRFGVNI